MITTTPETLASTVTTALRLDPPPSEADIDDALNRFAPVFGASPDIVQEARRLLHARFAIRMELGQTITGDGDHEPWLDSRRGAIDPFYWKRYREFLVGNGWPPQVAATLDRATDELLDLLGNPEDVSPWNRRGLVVGDVQSGKTATYAALICKAADAGYRMVILLTGTLENVRRQTQERLDAAFIGFDSRDFLAKGQARRKTHIGVGKINGQRDGIVFTSRDYDFRKATASALNISLDAVREPVLVVTKKNKGVLNRLSSWLRARNAGRDGSIDVPLLLIDDEADNASINTRQNPNETTAINGAIRDLLGLFTHSSYVGFTATPFANIFIDPVSTDAMIGDDLFPRDFIHALEPPTNYIGMNRLFPRLDPDDPAAFDPSDTIRSIDDTDDWLPVGHKKDTTPGPLPESLRQALRSFLLSCAIRDLRAAVGADGRGGGIHRSMLVNVSRFTDVQNRVANQLHVELEEIRAAVRLYGAMPPQQATTQSPLVAELADTFAGEFAQCGFGWEVVLSKMLAAVGPVRVQAVNQTTGAASLDYGATDKAPGVRVIAVGGNSLSRGLTLEGLSTSYFLRNAKAYDTLMQMGRWFGYRDGFDKLCRLWLTDEAESWYRHVTEATAELKLDFARMRRRKATPKEFGLRVRTHPDTLIITARNKMATGINISAVADERDISLIGRGIASSRLHSDRPRNQENLQIIDRFLANLVATRGAPVSSPQPGAVLWSDVRAELVANVLDNFLVHSRNFAFQGDAIAAFLRRSTAAGDVTLATWTVALLITGEAGPVDLASMAGIEVNATKRIVTPSPEDGSLLVSGKSARVGGPADIRHGLSLDDAAAGEAAWRQENPTDGRVPEGPYREAMKQPLLVLYLVRGFEQHRTEGQKKPYPESPYRDGLVLPAIALHFPGKRDPDAPRNLVHYRLNRVAQAELLPPDLDEEGATDDVESDD